MHGFRARHLCIHTLTKTVTVFGNVRVLLWSKEKKIPCLKMVLLFTAQIIGGGKSTN